MRPDPVGRFGFVVIATSGSGCFSSLNFMISMTDHVMALCGVDITLCSFSAHLGNDTAFYLGAFLWFFLFFFLESDQLLISCRLWI